MGNCVCICQNSLVCIAKGGRYNQQIGMGYIKPEIMEKTVKVTNEYFDVGRKMTSKEVFTNQFLKR